MPHNLSKQQICIKSSICFAMMLMESQHLISFTQYPKIMLYLVSLYLHATITKFTNKTAALLMYPTVCPCETSQTHKVPVRTLTRTFTRIIEFITQ